MNLSTFSLITILTVSLLLGCSAPVLITPEQLAKTQQLYESNQYDAAIAALEPLLVQDKTNVKARHTLIKCYAEKQELDFVESRYKQAVEEHPQVAALWFALGYIYYRQGIQGDDQGKFQEAVKTLEQALELDADIAIAHGTLGSMFLFWLEPQDFDRAIEELNTEIQLTPPAEIAIIAGDYTWLGIAYIKKGMYEDARAAYQIALKLETKVQGGEENLQKVGAVLEKLSTVEANPEDAQAHYTLGDAYLLLSDHSRAIVEYKKAIARGLNTDAVYVSLGTALLGMHRYPEAIIALKEALKINSGNDLARKLINYIKAEQSVAKNPNDAEIHFELGEALLALTNYSDAIVAYQRAIELGQRYIKNYRQLGIAYSHMGSSDDAINAFEAALQIEPKNLQLQDCLKLVKAKRALEKNPHDANAYFEIGRVSYAAPKLDTAIAYYQKALELNPNFAQAKECIEKAQHAKRAGELFEKGNTAYNRAAYQLALEAYNEAIEIYRRIGDRKPEATTLGNIGMVYIHHTCDYPKALEYHQQALAIAKEIGDRKGEAHHLGRIGLVYHFTGDYSKALEYHQQGLALAKEIGEREVEATNWGYIGLIHFYTGDYNKALEYHQQALTIAREMGAPRSESRHLSNIGSVYLFIGNYPEGLKYYQQALKISKETGDQEGEAADLGDMGVFYYFKGEHPQALEYYQQSLKINQEIGNRSAETTNLGNIGLVYKSMGDYNKALEYYQQALTIAQEIGYPKGEATHLCNLGYVYSLKDDYTKALEYCQSGLQLTRALGISDPAWQCQFQIGKIVEIQEKPEEAINNYKQAVEIIEGTREKLQTKEMQAEFMQAGGKISVYESLIKLLIELDRTEEAIEYLERSKSEQLKDAFGRFRSRTGDEAEQRKLDEFSQLEQRLIALETQLAEAKAGKAVENLTMRIAETKGQMGQFLSYLKEEYPELHGFLVEGNGVFKSVEDLQIRLPKDTLLVEYCLLEDFLAIFLVSYDSFESKVVTIKRAQIEELVWKYREKLKPRSRGYKRYGDKLYEHLIKPIEAEISQAKTVTIVPHGSLYYLPFHALQRKDDAGNRQFLLEWKRISYLSAATLLDLIQRERTDTSITAIAFGNADGTLPDSEVEVHEIKKIIPDTEVHVRDDAKKAYFLTRARDFNIVHLSTHGVLEPKARFSYIVLAPVDEGNLTIWELKGKPGLLKENTSLVVLSACETAIAKSQTEPSQYGSEFMSLANAFAQTGVPSLLATLWKVSDVSTKELMIKFYTELKSGQSDKLDALRAAQIALLKDETFSHPFYWAPFILIGDCN